MKYTWDSNFDLYSALAGDLVGFPQNGGGEGDSDISQTGRFVEVSGGPARYQVMIQGVKLWATSEGVIIDASADTQHLNKKLWMVRTVMPEESAAGSHPTRGDGEEVNLTSPELRDYFAMNALNAMLIGMKTPESKDDATMIMYSRAAYRWAQAMMIVAVDARGDAPESGEIIINTRDLTSNTDKLLYNITEIMKSK